MTIDPDEVKKRLEDIFLSNKNMGTFSGGSSMAYSTGYGPRSGSGDRILNKNGQTYIVGEQLRSHCCGEELNINGDDIYCSICNKLHEIREYYPDDSKYLYSESFSGGNWSVLVGSAGTMAPVIDTAIKNEKFVSYSEKKKHWLKSWLSSLIR